MSTHVYVFGSICRGEFAPGSDVDLLVISDEPVDMYDTGKFSVYSYDRLRQLWSTGNPFAWHLATEARIVHASDGEDWIAQQGLPAPYRAGLSDCRKFYELFVRSSQEAKRRDGNLVFELSCMYLALRNFATCFALQRGKPCFSRASPYLSCTDFPVSRSTFNVLVAARLLSTRGHGSMPSNVEVDDALSEADVALAWMTRLLDEIQAYE